ncbi:MAG: hypothetical protein EAZ08_06915 [Cytophagales bacterium]|nr:MAG: hypothetical protein EAZ08_06915 [Cytophagales bacterium]
MIFEFKNLGSIKEAQIEMGKLTVICGKNNTGKTYLTYAVWGFLYKMLISLDLEWEAYDSKMEEEIKNQGYSKVDLISFKKEFLDDVLPKIQNAYLEKLNQVFSANEDNFSATQFKVIYNEQDTFFEIETRIPLFGGWFMKEAKSNILEITINNSNTIEKRGLSNLYKGILQSFFFKEKIILLTAERTQTRLFQKELDIVRNELIKHKRFNILEKNISNIPLPIQENLDFARETENIIKGDSFLKEEYPELLKEVETILGVNYEVNDGMLRVYDKKANHTIPHYMASTSVRALADLHLWLKHQAQKGDLLMIDEPELNLHPENQIKMARLFAKLLNAGIRVWITTHSDYIVKELNNCIMLGNVSNRTEILEKYKGEYSENDILKAEDLKAYIAYNLPDGGSTVRKIEIDKYGMVESTFDETIDKMNEISQTFADNID